MRFLRTLLGMGVATTCAVAGLPGPAQAADPTTALVVSKSGDQRLDLLVGAFDDRDAEMEATLGAGDDFTLTAHFRQDELHYRNGVRTAPPAGGTWQEGRVYPATSAGGTSARLSVDGNGQTCPGTGKVTVKQVRRDAAGQLTAFAAAYEFRCDGETGIVDGEIRWNSDLDYVAALYGHTLGFDRVEIGGAPVVQAVRFASWGSVPITFGAASISGADASAFRIVGNDCAGRSLPWGEECTVLIEATTTSTAARTATLHLADDSTYGSRMVGLGVRGYHNGVGSYHPVAPDRLMDTRAGYPNLPSTPIGPGGEVDLQVTDRADVPAQGVGAVVLNVTVTGPTADGFVTVYPSGEARPTASSVNFAKGWLGSNNVTVKVGANGRVKVYNRNGSTHVVVDVVGYYGGTGAGQDRFDSPGSHFHPVAPTRLVDTRTTDGAVPAGGTRRYFVDFGPQLSLRSSALVLNITAVAPEKSGFLTAWSGTAGVPIASTVNYGAGKVVPNLAVVQDNYQCDCGGTYAVPTFSLYSSQNAHVVVDLVGVMAPVESVPNGLRLTPLSPTRIVDSRTGLGTTGALGPQVTRTVTAPSALVTEATRALAMNVTAVAPTEATVLTVWPAGTGLSKPTASNLNPAAGQTVSNAAVTGIGPADAFHAHNHAGSTHLVTDVVGRFDLYPYTVGAGDGFTVLRSGPALG
ncbi:hypothetical protein ACPFP2_05260 [Micromonospora citrea]|uniref:hypothetical protein n=1 Tax=Micromonospora citrea TaxID=47855 RepID=UPI003C6423A1